MNNFVVSWSGGKDACHALYLYQKTGNNLVGLITSFDSDLQHSKGHYLNKEILQAQAECINTKFFPFAVIDDYRQAMQNKLQEINNQHSINNVALGDIDLEAHKTWFEETCEQVGIKVVEPLWLMDRITSVKNFINYGFKTIIIAIQEDKIPPSLLGKTLTLDLVQELIDAGIDPSAEGGEFHTLVYDGPIFNKPLNISIKNSVQEKYTTYLQLELN